MAYTVYRVERKIAATGFWYEVMLSPFLRVNDAGKYISKYKNYYPENEAIYRVLDHEVSPTEYYRIKRFANRLPDPRTPCRV